MMELIIAALTLTIVVCAIVGCRNYRLLKQREKELHDLAYYDPLTELSNRLRFNDYATKLVELANINKQRLGFLLVDVDGFKQVNDTYGHDIGDKFLKELARRMNEIVVEREALCEDDCSFVARLGGDEFVIVIDRIRDAKEAEAIAERLFELTSVPAVVDNAVLDPSISVGISLYPYDGSTLSAALKAADLALYTAKENGKNKFFFHEHSMNTKFERQIEHEATIRYFIDTGDFKLHYQPIAETKSGIIQGAECLFAGNKLKYPNLNIQDLMITAEETGEIIELGEIILRRACEEFTQHIMTRLEKTCFLLSVNVSARQVEDEEFVERVKAIIKQTQIPPHMLGLEITETALITNYARTIKKLEQLKALGIKFSIDDFGKGYSSMSYLRRLSVHKIKIDASFIEDILDKKSSEIVRTLVLMSKTLGLVSVAEGVETEEQFRFLKRIECDQIQGYLISQPVPSDELVL